MTDDDRLGWPAASALIAFMALILALDWLSAKYPDKAPGFSCTTGDSPR